MRIDGAAALVAGGASGLGRAAADALRARGATVYVLDLPGARPAVEGGGLRFVPGDVRDEDQVAAAVRQAADGGELRICVNCAGIAPAARIVRDGVPHSLADFRRTVEVNLVGTFNVLRLSAAAMAGLPETGGERGVIVNTASVAAYDGQVGQAGYAASKGGVVSLTLTAARDLADARIRCATIAPGTFETPMLAGLPGGVRAALAASVPHPRRLGHPDEYAALAVHIVENPMLNGEVIRLDAALRMPPR
jgi:NAD(P)-dependent dehydrogenase (short-subunit alcohol dehydrogenase family)